MRVVFDHGTPAPLQRLLMGHTVVLAKAQGWDRFTNGDLLTAAEREGFDVVLTTDKNIRHQQNLTRRTIAIVVLPTPRWPVLRHVPLIVSAVNAATPGSYTEVQIPPR